MQSTDYLSLGFVSNDHLAVLPFIPMDTKVKMLSHKILGGGPAGNAAAGAATLGMKTAFVGTVGDDADGRMILDEFAREGVETSFVTVRRGATSAIAYLWIEEKTGNRSCAWTREGLDELTADEVTGNPALVEAIRHAKILHVDGHNAAGAIAAAKIAKEAGVTVMYDAGTHRDGRDELLGLADLIVCSEEFILKLVGEWGEKKVGGESRWTKEGSLSAEEAVRAVFEKYHPKVCGATMGVRGSMCFDGTNFVTCPAFPVEKVVDTTGCGDLFHVGFAVRWLETHDLLECQRFGAAVSALKCRGLSGRPPSAPTRDEVESFLESAFRRNAPTGEAVSRGCNSPNCTGNESAFRRNAPTGEAFSCGCNSPNCTSKESAFRRNAPTGEAVSRGCNSPNCTGNESAFRRNAPTGEGDCAFRRNAPTGEGA